MNRREQRLVGTDPPIVTLRDLPTTVGASERCRKWKQIKQRLVAKKRSASGPVRWERASKVVQFTATKTGGEKRELGKNSTQWTLW
jgi:hypothetical protein